MVLPTCRNSQCTLRWRITSLKSNTPAHLSAPLWWAATERCFMVQEHWKVWGIASSSHRTPAVSFCIPHQQNFCCCFLPWVNLGDPTNKANSSKDHVLQKPWRDWSTVYTEGILLAAFSTLYFFLGFSISRRIFQSSLLPLQPLPTAGSSFGVKLWGCQVRNN